MQSTVFSKVAKPEQVLVSFCSILAHAKLTARTWIWEKGSQVPDEAVMACIEMQLLSHNICLEMLPVLCTETTCSIQSIATWSNQLARNWMLKQYWNTYSTHALYNSDIRIPRWPSLTLIAYAVGEREQQSSHSSTLCCTCSVIPPLDFTRALTRWF